MPHLHLPIDHTDADLVLAANLAEIVGSEDLYVTWSHESGAGAVPEVDAVLVESPRPNLLVAFAGLVTAFWHALVGRPSDARVDATQHVGPARQGEPSV
jgi:hypothetical protein